MKRILALIIFASVALFCTSVFAQVAKIIDIKGEVLVKEESGLEWQKAKVNMFLNKNAEVKTSRSSQCTLALDEEMKNILTLKENSQIKIDNIIPSRISLPSGRVFSLIQNIALIQKFEIRTPTATAGARGTGLGVNSNKDAASVSCFEDKVYIQGLDQNGNVTGEQDISEGFGMDIPMGGQMGTPFELGSGDLRDWSDFKDNVEGIRGELQKETGGEQAGDQGGAGDTGSTGDLRQEQRGDFQDNTAQEERLREEANTGITEPSGNHL